MKQYDTLLQILEETLDRDLFLSFQGISEERKKKFLLHPDQSSILKCLNFIDEPSPHVDILVSEMQKFLAKQEEKMIMNSGLIIEGTSIRITIEDNNPLNSHDAHPDSNSADTGGKL